MNLTLWIIAGLLAAGFLVAGLTSCASRGRNWPGLLAGDGSWIWAPARVPAKGAVEILGAVGLILPALLEIVS